MALSLDANNLIKLIKSVSKDAIEAGSPFAMKVGEVVSANPLQISINQKITIPASQLLLTNAVRDNTVYMTVDHETEETSGGSGQASFASHSHEYKGQKLFTVHRALAKGEKVLLLRCDGGQKFIVLDRLEAP